MIKYIEIEKIDSDECSGLLLGNVIVMPKLDGSNGQVYLNDAGEVECASRRQILSENSTNQGFYNYVFENALNSFIQYFQKHTDHILYGEWLVPHTLKDYEEWAWRKFYVFDVFDTSTNSFLPYHEYYPYLSEYGINFIPPIASFNNPSIQDIQDLLLTNKFMTKDDKIGEGIVIKNYDFVNKYGRVTWGKIVRKEFQEQMKVEHPQLSKLSTELKIAQEYIVQARLEKVKAKMIVEKGGWNSKMIPEYLGRVWFELISEEMWHILKDYKNPVINFKELSQCVINQIKLVDKETF